MQAVVETLRQLRHGPIADVLDALQGSEPPDGRAGIYLTPPLAIPPRIVGDLSFQFHGARILPGRFVNPHFHRIGAEPYRMFSDVGAEMHLGTVEPGRVRWNAPVGLKASETLVIEETTAHCLRNIGKIPLDFAFACPANHLIDHSPTCPQGDRYFTMDLIDGVPPALLAHK